MDLTNRIEALGISRESLRFVFAFSSNLGLRTLKDICKCPKLIYLDVSRNTYFSKQLEENVFSFDRCKNSLLVLDVSSCDLNPKFIESFLECSDLISLDVSFNEDCCEYLFKRKNRKLRERLLLHLN